MKLEDDVIYIHKDKLSGMFEVEVQKIGIRYAISGLATYDSAVRIGAHTLYTVGKIGHDAYEKAIKDFGVGLPTIPKELSYTVIRK